MSVIIGHGKIMNFFERTIANGRLSHAYGFIGPSGVGKKTVALTLAAQILGTTPEKLPLDPDFILVERSEDEKTGKLKKVITVEQARNLKAKLQMTSWQGGAKVAVIDGGELFNAESGNALLKILEEPPEKVFFFIVINDETGLLSTIRSRLQIFYLSPVATGELENGLREMFTPEEAGTAARRALGRPGKAVRLQSEEEKAEYEKQLDIFKKLLGAPFYEKLKLIEANYGDKEDGERGREKWQEILDGWITFGRDILLKKFGALAYAGEPGLAPAVNYSGSELIRMIDGFTRVKQLLRENVHPRLAIEEALLKIK